jgi:hypothetical protein
VEQRHKDKRKLQVFWRERLSSWRCTVFLDVDTELCLAQIDLDDDDGTFRVEAFEPCSVTVSSKKGLFCLTRYASL